MASLSYRQLGIKRTGNLCKVPENPYAKLMYYLDCVDSLIQYNFNKRLTNYQEYYNLTEKEKEALKILCILLNPKILIENKVIIYAPELCENATNEFYEITNTNLGFHANEFITIGGVEVKVRKIMAIKGQWVEKNFVKPLEDIKNYEKQKEIEQSQRYYIKQNEIEENQRYYTPRIKPSEKEKDNSCCFIW